METPRPRYSPDNSYEARKARARVFGFILPEVHETTPAPLPMSPDCFISPMGDIPAKLIDEPKPKKVFPILEALPSLSDNLFIMDDYRKSNGNSAA